MHQLLYVLLISILATHSLKGMDLVEKGVMSLSKSLRPNHSAETIPSKDREPALKAANKKKRQKSNSTNSPNPVRVERLTPIYETPIVKANEHALIIATCENNLVKIKFFLHNIFLNPNTIRENKSGNTPLHCAAIHKHVEAMNLFMEDPRVDASERNKDDKTARALIAITAETELEDFTLRFKLFARASLDFFAVTQANKMKSDYAEGKTTPEDYKAAIQQIKNNFSAVKEKQIGEGEEEIPKEAATLPPYADDLFIKSKLNFLLAHMK